MGGETIVIDADDVREAQERGRRAARRRAVRAACRDEVVMAPTGIVWTLVAGRSRVREVVGVVGSRELTQPVDTAIYCYQMLCNCGRVRHARPNALHQVIECRVCAKLTKLEARRARERGEP